MWWGISVNHPTNVLQGDMLTIWFGMGGLHEESKKYSVSKFTEKFRLKFWVMTGDGHINVLQGNPLILVTWGWKYAFVIVDLHESPNQCHSNNSADNPRMECLCITAKHKEKNTKYFLSNLRRGVFLHIFLRRNILKVYTICLYVSMEFLGTATLFIPEGPYMDPIKKVKFH